MTDFALSRPLEIGQRLSQSGVEDAFDTNFGYQFKGITLRSPDDGRYVILLANEGEIYDDELGQGATFVYEGEGVPRKGDQKPTAANEALMNAVRDPLPIYFFTSREGEDEYEYRGLVEVEDYRYVSDGNRMVYRFDMRQLSISSWEQYGQTEAALEARSQRSPSLTGGQSRHVTSSSQVRSAIFARRVKRRNDYACAACGSRRFTPHGRPEVEAAHLYPKSEDGPDDFRNGMPLCKVHHWAFDSGWFSVANDYELLVQSDANRDPPDVVATLAGERLAESSSHDYAPHPTYLAGHRRLHGFE